MSKNEFVCDCNAVHEDVVKEVLGGMNCAESLGAMAEFFRIIGDPTRLKIIWALELHEMCVCDLANVLSMTKSAISHQLATLRNGNLVKYRRDRKTVYYSLADEHVKTILEFAMEHVNEEKQENR